MHEQHRQRLKDRFLHEGLDNFEPHNVLELLLFYSIPRKDVNDTAHELINRFGSVSAACDASYDELIKVPGIKEHSATLLKLMSEFSRYYVNDKNAPKKTPYTLETIGQYFVNKFVGVEVETVYLAMLDNKRAMIDCVKMYEGSVNSAHFDTRSMVKKALMKDASAVVIAHNHPNGFAVPSSDDKASTRTLDTAFEMMGIKLLEHIVVAGDKFCPIMVKSSGFFRSGDFVEFYGEE